MNGIPQRAPAGADRIGEAVRREGAIPTPLPPLAERTVAWHDLECGAYRADLEVWEQIAARSKGSILELGCGSGRVTRQLGRRGHQLVGLDRDLALLAALRRRSAGLPIETVSADARSFELRRGFALAIAPMQLAQLLNNAEERREFLAHLAAHLKAGGRAALAIVERVSAGAGNQALSPDLAQIGGCVYTSTPFEANVSEEAIVIRRWRQLVCEDGSAEGELDEVVLRQLTASQLEREAAGVGFRALDRIAIPASDDHVGSTVVLLQKET